MTDAIVILVTAGSEAEASSIGRQLVSERLIACANVVPRIRSIYRWEGAVHDDEEWLLVLKTVTGRFEAVDRRVRELHSYDVPEVLALPVEAGSRAYLDWLAAETSPG